jgi:hypothetical protein
MVKCPAQSRAAVRPLEVVSSHIQALTQISAASNCFGVFETKLGNVRFFTKRLEAENTLVAARTTPLQHKLVVRERSADETLFFQSFSTINKVPQPIKIVFRLRDGCHCCDE